ncbi:MAG: acyclic terpene utilization AtuA family protein [Rubrivivax sp.]
MRRTVRVGGASGFWGDSMAAAPQLVAKGALDYLVFDYLAETTMAVLAGARAKRPEGGYATDFVDIAMKAVLPEVMRQGIKVVSNAGGIHPQGCANALRALADSLGLKPRIAVVLGDDVSPLLPTLRAAGTRDLATGQPLPERVLSANAYLGALPVARALAEGADIVITGRCVDSAVTLGPLMHEFGWTAQDHDLLAAGSLAGHLIECGCQATGGLHTDWQDIPDWPDIGYPVLECHANGRFVLTKPEGTGGRVLRAAVAEQLLYEIGDPGAYLLPDVCCDFRQVRIEQQGPDRVEVSGARGTPPTAQYKVSATALDGFRCAGTLVIVGMDAAAKARRTGEAILQRVRRILQAQGLPDFKATAVELLGAETLYGPHARAGAAREVMLRVVADHAMKPALDIFAREIAPAGTSWSPGTTSPGGGRPSPSPLIKPLAFFVDKATVPVQVVLEGQALAVDVPLAGPELPVDLPPAGRAAPPQSLPESAPWGEGLAGDVEPQIEVPLVRLAWARSGDKGNTANIGVIARRPEWLPLLWARLTPQAVHAHLAHLVHGPVERFHLPGISAMNFLLHEALDGGGPASRRMDPLGKGLAQILLDMPVRVPAEWLG